MIEKYRSCLVIIMHLRGKIIWYITDYVGIFGNTSYGCLLLRLTSTHCSWPCGGPLFVFLYFFRCEWVFAGICFWYFPLPAGALDLRPWPFCRPGRKLALAQIPAQCKPLGIVPSCIVFVRILFLYCYIFVLHIYVLTLARIPAHCKPLGILPSYYNHKFGCTLSIVFFDSIDHNVNHL